MRRRRGFFPGVAAAPIVAMTRAALVVMLLLSLSLCTQPSNPVTGSDEGGGGGGGGGSLPEGQLTGEGRNRYPSVDDGYVVWVHNDYVSGEEIYIANLESAVPTPTRLTTNGGEKGHPTNHASERIVWQGRSGASDDWEIWVYDALSVPRYAQFTDNSVPDMYPDLAGAGDFAWLQGPPMYEAVCYWDEYLHSQSVISDSCCPTSEWTSEIPSADDGCVVWRSYNRAGSAGFRVYLWDGTLEDITSEIDGQMTIHHSLHEGTIAYEYGGGTPEIKYWDGAAIHDVEDGFGPSLCDGAVAYEIWDGLDWEIRYWDGATVRDITDNDYNDTDPSLHGDFIAWVGRPPGSDDQIFYIDLTE